MLSSRADTMALRQAGGCAVLGCRGSSVSYGGARAHVWELVRRPIVMTAYTAFAIHFGHVEELAGPPPRPIGHVRELVRRLFVRTFFP